MCEYKWKVPTSEMFNPGIYKNYSIAENDAN